MLDLLVNVIPFHMTCFAGWRSVMVATQWLREWTSTWRTARQNYSPASTCCGSDTALDTVLQQMPRLQDSPSLWSILHMVGWFFTSAAESFKRELVYLPSACMQEFVLFFGTKPALKSSVSIAGNDISWKRRFKFEASICTQPSERRKEILLFTWFETLLFASRQKFAADHHWIAAPPVGTL